MDWSKQTEEMVNNWAALQKNMWETWISSMQSLTRAKEEASDSTYQQALRAWEESVRKALDAQAQWTRLWADGVSAAAGTSDPAGALTRNTQDMMKAWTQAHRQLWESWFNALRQWDPEKTATPDVWEQEARRVLSAWDEAIKAAQQAVSAWGGKA